MPQEADPDASDATLAPRPAAPKTFASGRYVVIRVLGEGGQKIVYLVHDNVLDRDCALSMVRNALLDPEELERLKREAQAMARLGSQPNVVTVFDFGDEDGASYLVCEYVAGGDLRRELNAAAGQLPLWRAISIASDVAQGLEAAHARGVVHRDLKPANIWLGDRGVAKLGDFGLAFSLDRSRLTMPGTVMGTAAYLSPEQALGEPVTECSDLYALGCLLYEMVCGRPPFADANPTVVISQHINAVPAPPSSHRPNIPPALDDLILRLLSKSPARRPESASAVLEELRRIGRSAPESPSWRAASLHLAGRRSRIPFLSQLRPAAAYDLTVRNDSDDVLDLRLSAKDDDAACRFVLPDRVSILPHATTQTVVRARPRKRRWRGASETHAFTVYGSTGAGEPPAAVSGQYEDQPSGWLPAAGGVSMLGVTAGVVAVLSMSGAFGKNNARPDPLKIGILMPFSGQLSIGPSAEKYGPAYLNAARIAVAEINADGGVLGQPVSLAQADSAGDADVGVQEARRLVGEGVHAIIGEMDPVNTLEIANEVTTPEKVVQISPFFVDDEIMTSRAGAAINNDPPFLFKSTIKPEAEGVALAKMIVEGQYASVCSLYDPGSEIFKATEDALKRATPAVHLIEVAHDNSVQGTGLVPPTEEQFSADALGHAKGELAECQGADALVLNVGPDFPPAPPGQFRTRSFLLDQALSEGFRKILVVSILLGDVTEPEGPAQILDAVGWERAAGIQGVRTGRIAGGQGDKFDQAYKGRFGDPPPDVQDGSSYPPDLRSVYDAVYLIALAAEKAGSTRPDAIRTALSDVANAHGTIVHPGPLGRDPSTGGGFKQAAAFISGGTDIDYEGAAGPIEFNSDRDNVRGAVDIWHVDPEARTLRTDRTLIVDLATGEAVPPAAGEAVVSSAFVVPVTLTASPGFEITADAEAAFTVERGSPLSRGAYLSFVSPVSVYDSQNKTVPVPSDLMSWITSNPKVRVVKDVSDVTIDGRAGKQVDVRGGSEGAMLFDMGMVANKIGNQAPQELRILLFPEEEARLIVTEVDGKLIVVTAGPLRPSFERPADVSLEQVTPDIAAMLATVRFE